MTIPASVPVALASHGFFPYILFDILNELKYLKYIPSGRVSPEDAGMNLSRGRIAMKKPL